MRKRILALLLAIAMLLTMLPTAVFADEEITAEGESAAEAAEISPQAEETPGEPVPVQESPAQELPAEQETPAQNAASDAASEEKQETGEPEEPEEPEETEEAQITAEALDARENEYPWEEMDDSAFAQWVCSGEQDAYILEIWQEQGAAYASFSARVEAMEAAEAKEQVEHYVLMLTGEEAADGEPEEQTMDIPLDFGAPISADESLWYYVYWKAGMMYIPSLMSSKDQLTQAEQAIYDALEKQIVAVAEKGGSTKFTLEKAVLPAAAV